MEGRETHGKVVVGQCTGLLIRLQLGGAEVCQCHCVHGSRNVRLLWQGFWESGK